MLLWNALQVASLLRLCVGLLTSSVPWALLVAANGPRWMFLSEAPMASGGL